MSARSRYLQAISSPRGDDPVAPSNKFGANGRGGAVVVGAPPPPPPPGPPPGPPPKNVTKAARSPMPQSQQNDKPLLNRNRINIHTNNNDENDNNEREDEQRQQKDEPEKNNNSANAVAKGGATLSPREEIPGSGNVAKFQQMLWGGQGKLGLGTNAAAALPPATPPRHSYTSTIPRRVGGGSNSVTPTNNNNGVADPSPKYKRNAPPPLGISNAEDNNEGGTPSSGATPQQQRSTTANSTAAATTGVRKFVAPTPPSRVLSSPYQKGSPGVGVGASGGSSSSLRQRAGNVLSLTPLDTSFGNGGGNNNNSSATTLVLPSPQTDKSDNNNSARAADIVRQYSGKVGSINNNEYPPKMINDIPRVGGDDASSRTPLPLATTSAASPTDTGISTFTAFKRPNVKVGIVFTRRSAQYPDVAIISRIMPESIFRRHLGGGGGSSSLGMTGLEGAEVIAVNGTPVRNPRHAAELVARAVEEVRLTVKRGGGGDGGNDDESGSKTMMPMTTGGVNTTKDNKVSNNDSTIPQGQKMTPPIIPIESNDNIAKLRGAQKVDEPIVASSRTEDSRVVTDVKLNEDEEDEWGAWKETQDVNQQQQATIMTESSAPTREAGGGINPSSTLSKSAEIAERRRKVAQAMLLSDELVNSTSQVAAGNDDDDSDIAHEYHNLKKANEAIKSPNDIIQASRSSDDDDDEVLESRTIDLDDTRENIGNVGNNTQSITSGVKIGSSPSKISVANATMGVAALGVLSTSAADRRRRAALEMYHSTEMVPDNVDDVRLGTIDVIGVITTNTPQTKNANKDTTLLSWMTAKPLNERNISYNSETSKQTDVTTSSAATAQMGTGNRGNQMSPRSPLPKAHNENSATSSTAYGINNEGSAMSSLPSAPPIRLESPAAQRRRERAEHRRLLSDVPPQSPGVRGAMMEFKPIRSPPPVPPRSTPTITVNMLQRRLEDNPPMTTVPSDETDELVIAALNPVQTHDKSSVESSTAAVKDAKNADNSMTPRSAMGFSKMKSRSRLRLGQFSSPRLSSPKIISSPKEDGQRTGYAQVAEDDVLKKKKSSIFGVARLIRISSLGKSKSKEKSASNDASMVEVGQSPNAISTESLVPNSSISPSMAVLSTLEDTAVAPITVKEKSESTALPPSSVTSSSRAVSGPDPFNNFSDTLPGGGWENSNFFDENPFASSPFDNDPVTNSNGGKDAFGFPSTSMSAGAGEKQSSMEALDSVGAATNTFFDNTTGVDLLSNNHANTAMLPVDKTPRRDNATQRLHDASSLEGSEMSEVTDPTFVSTKGADIVKHVKTNDQATAQTSDSSSMKENVSKESKQLITTPEFEKQCLVKGDLNADTIVASNSKEKSYEKNDDRDGHDMLATLPTNRSRILSKYAKSSKERRTGTTLNSADTNDKIETPFGSSSLNNRSVIDTPSESVARSSGSVGSSSLNSRTLVEQQSVNHTTASVGSGSVSSGPGRNRQRLVKAGVAATSVAASAIALAGTPSLSEGRSSLKSHQLSPTRASTSSNISNRSPIKSASSSNSSQYPKSAPSVVSNTEYTSMESRLGQIKDPIQRAGVRLLWAAAIPIQTQLRRFMARQAAIRRMCAVLTIQAFVRRWLAERDLEIAIWSAIQIQASFRGWFARDSLEDNHYCATQIQRVARGYLATMHVFENLYSITIVQSVARMHLAINRAVDRLSSIIAIQSWWRGIQARDHVDKMDFSAVAIQTQWRRYLAQMTYQFDMIDVIIVQSVARRWRDRRALATMRLQNFVRVLIAKKRLSEKKSMHVLLTRHTSATMIQARWRSHIAQTQLLYYIAATRIQATWRSYIAQVDMLVTIVNVIVIQSLWRRRKAVKLFQPLLHRMKLAKERKRQKSATHIQSAWRGFVVFSTFLIKRYENKAAATIQACWRGYWQAANFADLYCATIKVQALVRGCQERSLCAFHHDCATIIQCSSRGMLVRKECHTECMVSILIAAAANSLRVRNSARRLQFWWMGELLKKKKKGAALVIERFFIYVKKEVEREVAALKQKKKEKRRRRKVKDTDDYILERAWLGVADNVSSPVAQATVEPTHDTVASQHLFDEVHSEISGLTDLDFGYRTGSSTRNRPRA